MAPLIFIFNLALKSSCYPEVWKMSRVTPIPKGGGASLVENYRPIAVLSAFGKVFESILNRHITNQIQTQLSEVQHGFRAGKSTVTNQINFVDYVVSVMDQRKQVDAAYFDFKKAFDRVDNDVLLKKFAKFGFSPKLLKFFAGYFSNRVQYVQLSNFRSELYETSSGVSQGSTLGPTQFLIMINDLPSVVKSAECLMFADDLKLHLSVGSVDDCHALQTDIDNVVEWAADNHLEFNSSKCKVMTFARLRSPIDFNYHMSGVSLERVMEIKDLGVKLDVELKFNQHIEDICDRAFKSLGFVIRQTARFADRGAIVLLFYALVRSKLEYNSIVWDPHESKYKLMIEKVQRKFARYLYKKMYGYYPFLYPSLFVSGMVGINTLELRRSCALMMHYHQLLNGVIDNPSTLACLSLSVPVCARDPRACCARRPLAAPARVRTTTARYAPTTHAISLLNDMIAQIPEVDIFNMKFNRMLTYCIKFNSDPSYYKERYRHI